MKILKLLFIVFFTIALSIDTEAQSNNENKSKSGISAPDIIKGRKLRRYLGFELGLNNYISKDENFDLNQGRSWVFKYNFLEKGYNLGSPKVRFITGLGIQTNLYRFKNNVFPTPGDFTDVLELTAESSRIRKNNIRVSYLTLPLMVDFNTNPTENKFHIAAGGEIGLRIGTRYRLRYEENSDTDIENIVRNNFNVNLLNPSLMLRIGYKDYTLFANYSLLPLFEKGKGIELTPFQFGIRLVAL